MLHGANEGAWVSDTFKGVFEGVAWTCHAPDLIGHGGDAGARAILRQAAPDRGRP